MSNEEVAPVTMGNEESSPAIHASPAPSAEPAGSAVPTEGAPGSPDVVLEHVELNQQSAEEKAAKEKEERTQELRARAEKNRKAMEIQSKKNFDRLQERKRKREGSPMESPTTPTGKGESPGNMEDIPVSRMASFPPAMPPLLGPSEVAGFQNGLQNLRDAMDQTNVQLESLNTKVLTDQTVANLAVGVSSTSYELGQLKNLVKNYQSGMTWEFCSNARDKSATPIRRTIGSIHEMMGRMITMGKENQKYLKEEYQSDELFRKLVLERADEFLKTQKETNKLLGELIQALPEALRVPSGGVEPPAPGNVGAPPAGTGSRAPPEPTEMPPANAPVGVTPQTPRGDGPLRMETPVRMEASPIVEPILMPLLPNRKPNPLHWPTSSGATRSSSPTGVDESQAALYDGRHAPYGWLRDPRTNLIYRAYDRVS